MYLQCVETDSYYKIHYFASNVFIFVPREKSSGQRSVDLKVTRYLIEFFRYITPSEGYGNGYPTLLSPKLI